MIRRTPQNRHYHGCKDLQLQIILKYQIGPRAATGFCYSTDCSGTRAPAAPGQAAYHIDQFSGQLMPTGDRHRHVPELPAAGWGVSPQARFSAGPIHADESVPSGAAAC